MCTVIYIPNGTETYLCSVRDENPFRERAHFPAKIQGRKTSFWAPIDPEAGGTWWTINSFGQTLILLNGAFTNHLPNTKVYRKSRGLIVKELSQETDLEKAWNQLDLEEVEPFTLIIKQEKKLITSRWNGQVKFWNEMDPDQAHIWSSATLYPFEIRRQRELLFFDFLSAPISKAQEIETFLFENSEPENGFIMHRHEQLRSLSISLFDFNATSTEVTLRYHDLLEEKAQSMHIQFGE